MLLEPSPRKGSTRPASERSEEHTSELQSRLHLACRLLLGKKTATPAARLEAGAHLHGAAGVVVLQILGVAVPLLQLPDQRPPPAGGVDQAGRVVDDAPVAR